MICQSCGYVLSPFESRCTRCSNSPNAAAVTVGMPNSRGPGGHQTHLRPCPACQTLVSPQAAACPNCGHPITKPGYVESATNSPSAPDHFIDDAVSMDRADRSMTPNGTARHTFLIAFMWFFPLCGFVVGWAINQSSTVARLGDLVFAVADLPAFGAAIYLICQPNPSARVHGRLKVIIDVALFFAAIALKTMADIAAVR
jgi:hypothetical protein